MRRSLFALLLFGCGLSLSVGAQPQPVEYDEVALPEPRDEPAEARDTALGEHVDGLVGMLQRDHGLGGLTLSIVRDDEIAMARGYGLADIGSARPVHPDETLFRIGSVSKTFIWTAVMILAERGLIDLDADLNDYLSQFEITPAFLEPVTMRQIMHHRGGFEDSLRLFAVADDDPRSLAELLAEHQPTRVFPPGQRSSYSNWASALAALVVENVSGRPYGDFLQDELLTPLGMDRTTWLAPSRMDPAARARLATGYKPAHGTLDLQGFMQIGAYWPAGGMASTASDMARWMRFHLNAGELDGVRLVQADTHAQMWTRAFPDRPLAADVAHGFQDRIYRDLRLLGHGGGTAAFLTNMVMVPELGLGVFFSHNSAHTAAPIRHLADLVIDHVAGFDPPPFQLNEDDEGAQALAELAGTYLNNRRVFSTFSAVFGAPGLVRITPHSADSLSLSGGGEVTYFQRLEDDVFVAADGSRISFVRNDRRQVEALADGTGVHTLERLGWFSSPMTLLAALGLAVALSLSHLLGFWRRAGRGVYPGFPARMAGTAAGLGVAAMLALVIAMIALVAYLAELDMSTMPDTYPLPLMFAVHYIGWVVVAAALVLVLAQWPAWSGSGWGWFKRLHFGLFTLALLFLGLQLWQWRVIGAPVL